MGGIDGLDCTQKVEIRVSSTHSKSAADAQATRARNSSPRVNMAHLIVAHSVYGQLRALRYGWCSSALGTPGDPVR